MFDESRASERLESLDHASPTSLVSRAAAAKREQAASHFKSTCTQFHAAQVISPEPKEVN